MKRFLSIALCICFILSAVPAALAQTDYTEEITRVCSLGIMGNVEDGDFRADDKITRAEFTAVICRMFSYDNIGGQDTVFTDVPSSHWASGFISFAHNIGWINGVGNGLFLPEAEITYGEAVKILVCVLNYDFGPGEITFPGGYISIAGSIGIRKNAVDSSEAITRAQTAGIIDNALDIYPMEWNSDGDLVKSDKTLFETISDRKELGHYSGILTSTGNYSIINKKSVDRAVTVDDIQFYTDKNYDEYLGQYVDAYYNTDSYEIVEISPVQRRNIVVEIPAEDTEVHTTGIDYYGGGPRKKTIKINSETIFLLNGDIVQPSEIGSVYHGKFKAVENNRDSIYDVILITKAESFIVESVSAENMAVYFKDEKTYHGRKGFVFKFDDADKTYNITDKNGESREFSDIEPGCSISFVGNSDESVVTAYVNNEKCSGKIEGISPSEGEVVINGKTYQMGKDADGNDTFNPSNIIEGEFVIDAFGYIIGAWEKQNTKFAYAYVENAYIDESGTEMIIRLVKGTEPVEEVKTINNNRIVSYYLQNSAIETFKLADKVIYGNNPINAKGSKISSAVLDPAGLKNSIVGYTLDNDGKINKLNVYSVPTNLPSYEFNADIFSFGGMRVSRGFIKDEHTMMVCVPNAVRSREDYNVNVKITDDSSYSVYGILGVSENEYGSAKANAEPCDIIILKSDMDSTLPSNISSDSDICIVGKSVISLNEDNELRYELDILNGSAKKTYYAPEGSVAYADAAKLRKGDLIQFTANSKNEFTGIKKRASVQGLKEYTGIDNVYGEVTEVTYNTYDYFSNEMVDMLSVNTGDGVTDIRIYKDDGQKVYLYDRKSGYIYPSSTADLLSSDYFGDEASKVFALMQDGDAEAIVVIWD
ncbi:MAG: S-layer homology domain-containing protein [Clostridia bacterium]|nr:S-layer homology domain-containing protein [Clostridia bacterium]